MTLQASSRKFKTERYLPYTIEGVNPGAGNPYEYAVPANMVQHVIGVSFLFTTVGAAADRQVYLCMNTAGVNVMHVNPIVVPVPTGNAWTHNFSIGIAPVDMTTLGSFTANPMTCAIELVASMDDRLCIEADNLQVNDTITNILLRVREWGED